MRRRSRLGESGRRPGQLPLAPLDPPSVGGAAEADHQQRGQDLLPRGPHQAAEVLPRVQPALPVRPGRL